MKTWCNYCDPKFFVIYGCCGNCGRRCEPPMIGSDSSIEDYMKFRRKWNEDRVDSINDYIRQGECDE